MSFTPITLEFPIAPVAKARPRFTKAGRTYTPEKTVQFETQLQWHWRFSGKQMLPVAPTQLIVVCLLERPKSKKLEKWPITRPDVDNFAKAVLDGLNGFAWKDDSQIVELQITKRYAVASPKILIHINPMEAA